jgi:hypothetical protein
LQFATVFSTPKLAGYGFWGILQVKGNAMAQPFGNCRLPKYDDVAAKLPCKQAHAWRRSLPLAMATMISSQATVLAHHLKPFFFSLEL